MQDLEGIAHARFCRARIRLRRGGGQGEAQTIADELGESFQISLKLGRADFIGGGNLSMANSWQSGDTMTRQVYRFRHCEECAAR